MHGRANSVYPGPMDETDQEVEAAEESSEDGEDYDYGGEPDGRGSFGPHTPSDPRLFQFFVHRLLLVHQSRVFAQKNRW